MLEALRTLRLELDSLLASVRAMPGVLVVSASFRRRIQQFYLSWSNLRPRLEAAQIPLSVIQNAENLAADVARLTSTRSRKDQYRAKLSALRKVLAKDFLLEIGRLGQSSPPRTVSAYSIENSLLPEIPGLTNELIPNALLGWMESMRGFLRNNIYDRNVFIMVAYRPSLKKVIADVTASLIKLDLNPIVASDHNLTDDLYNPMACLLCCQYGVAIFDRGETQQLHNANIVYELAMMQTLKRQCVILKHRAVKTMPSDFLHKLYEPYRTSKDAVKAVKKWWGRIQKNV